MSGMNKAQFFQAEILADKIVKGLAGMKAIAGTGVGQVLMSMPHGSTRIGEKVKVPYFTSLGRMEDLTDDNQALNPDSISSTVEEATIRRSGKAFSATKWAQFAELGNPYDMCAAAIANLIQERIDDALLEALVNPLAANANVTDVTLATDPLLTHDNFLEARSKWGDETRDITALIVHSQTEKALRKLKDDAGRPLITDMVNGQLSRFNGVQIYVSDKMPVSGNTFTSLLCKSNAAVFWMNGSPSFRQAEDALADADLAAVHIYWAAHRYLNLNGGTKPGVQILKHQNG